MLLYFKSPYNSMLNIGLIISIIMIIMDVILFFNSKERNSIIIGKFAHFKIDNFLFFLGDVILIFLWNLGIWITIYYFTPSHLIISESIYEMIYFIKLIWNEKNRINNNLVLFILVIFYLFSSIIIIISSLILNEIIIINYYDLNKYTKSKILERERFDTQFADILLEDDKNTKDSNLGTNSNANSIIDNNTNKNNITREKDFSDEN